jgi:hypothetical protein
VHSLGWQDHTGLFFFFVVLGFKLRALARQALDCLSHVPSGPRLDFCWGCQVAFFHSALRPHMAVPLSLSSPFYVLLKLEPEGSLSSYPEK